MKHCLCGTCYHLRMRMRYLARKSISGSGWSSERIEAIWSKFGRVVVALRRSRPVSSIAVNSFANTNLVSVCLVSSGTNFYRWKHATRCVWNIGGLKLRDGSRIMIVYTKGLDVPWRWHSSGLPDEWGNGHARQSVAKAWWETLMYCGKYVPLSSLSVRDFVEWFWLFTSIWNSF